jgi:site-specific recombinase XerD
MTLPATVSTASEFATRETSGLGAAADRFARTTLRKSAQTQRTYAGAYRRFAVWLAAYTEQPTPHVREFTADALAAYLDELEDRGRAPGTIKKERAALNRFAKYLHTLGAIDATAILLVEGSALHERERTRDALDAATWLRVKALARARLSAAPRARATRPAALRDLCLLLLLGEQGLRSDEARSARSDWIFHRGGVGSRPWLRVTGKGNRVRELPLATETAEALAAWETERPVELREEPLLLPRLGRPRLEGANTWDDPRCIVFPRAGGKLSAQGLSDVVKPLMLAAGVTAPLAHPHVLRHTYGSLHMAHQNAELSRLQRLMGHASPETTSIYVHHDRQQLEDDLVAREREPSALAAGAQRRQDQRARRGAS